MKTCYQLRKIGLPASVEKVRNCSKITSKTTLIGRGQAVDIFLDSNIRKGLISRAHAYIIQNDVEVNGEVEYEIVDNSLNGTYVNDVRINGSVILKDGDTIAFGHLRGYLIKPGTLAPQKETEFLFKFEKCSPHSGHEDKMVDLNSNSSVFMSPKSPIAVAGENLTPHLAVTNDRLSKSSSPPEKRRKYPPLQDHSGKNIAKKSRYSTSDEEDLKNVVANATARINSSADTSDDGSFVIDLETKANDKRLKQVPASNSPKVLHPRDKVLPMMKINSQKIQTTPFTEKDKSGFSKKDNSKNRSTSEKVIHNIDSDESEIESESESEYIEDSDSEKSEEIPDDSSDNEYIPIGKSPIRKKQSPYAFAHLKKKPKANKFKGRITSKKKINNYVHDKCDSKNCKIPSSNLKTVTWVQCDNCDAWFHVSCSGLTLADAKKKDTIFRCGCS